MAAFPSAGTLLFTGFKPQRAPGVTRTAAEDGFVKQTKTVSRVLIKRTVVYRFASAADYAAFLAWYEDTIGRVGWFDWTDPVTSTTKSVRIAGGELDETPQRKNLGRWTVAMTLEGYGL